MGLQVAGEREGAWGGTGRSGLALPLQIVGSLAALPGLTPSFLKKLLVQCRKQKQNTEFEVSSRDASESWGEIVNGPEELINTKIQSAHQEKLDEEERPRAPKKRGKCRGSVE